MELSVTSKLPPRKPCFAMFHGVRQSRPGYVETIHEPVKVVELQNGKDKELAVCMFGRSTRWPLSTFEGYWTQLETETA